MNKTGIYRFEVMTIIKESSYSLCEKSHKNTSSMMIDFLRKSSEEKDGSFLYTVSADIKNLIKVILPTSGILIIEVESNREGGIQKACFDVGVMSVLYNDKISYITGV